MQIEQRPERLSSSTLSDLQKTKAVQAPKRTPVPAVLPVYTRAAAAQRLSKLPEAPTRGAYYAVPHIRRRPPGWRTKRYVKRKNLHGSNTRLAAAERADIQRAILPMALGALACIVILASALVTIDGAVQAIQQRYAQQITTLQDILPRDSLKAYDMHGTLIFQMVDQGLQTSVSLSKISPNLIHAEIAIEDQYFWTNPGYDITGIVRAALDDLTHGRIVSGGSTITQQLIKNAIVGSQNTIIRKLQEIILAPAITRYYTKQQILEMYLNTTFYGEQAYGADAAAFKYFNLHDTPAATAAGQLDIAQAATLAGIPSSPIARDPFLHPRASLARTTDVLKQMYLQGYISHDQEMAALVEIQDPHFLQHGEIDNSAAPHFMNYALNELARDLHVKVPELSRAGLIVSTTLDLPLQNQILKIAQQHIAQLAKPNHMSNAAEVLINYHNGAIRVLLGNINPNDPRFGAFDVASQGYRQSGSSFKPFIYATAFAKGISPGMPVVDEPFTIQLCCGLPSYTPSNYDLRFHGLISFRYALQNSFNVPAVKLLSQVGVEDSLHTAQDMGITDYEGTPNYTMVLGTLSIHLLDETAAYGVFANGGVRVPPHAIDTVVDPQGHVIWQAQTQGTRVISKQVAFIMTNVLSDNNSRTYEFGKCNPLLLYSSSDANCWQGKPGVIRPAAAKTGTSQDFRDNWTVGYTTDYVMGVWAGNDDNSPMVNVTGITGAAPIWHDSMLLAEQGQSITAFAGPPPGVVQKTVSYPGITTTDWYLQ